MDIKIERTGNGYSIASNEYLITFSQTVTLKDVATQLIIRLLIGHTAVLMKKYALNVVLAFKTLNKTI